MYKANLFKLDSENKIIIIAVDLLGTIIGKYNIPYSQSFDPTQLVFCPFKHNNNWYALYSPNKYGTRLLNLTTMKDMGGEPFSKYAFMPKELFVPVGYIRRDSRPKSEPIIDSIHAGEIAYNQVGIIYDYYNFGVISGCFFGDSSDRELAMVKFIEDKNGNLKTIKLDHTTLGHKRLPIYLKLNKCIEEIFVDSDAGLILLDIPERVDHTLFLKTLTPAVG